MSNPSPPKLSFDKNHKLIPDDVRELQDNMVNKFQFEKLIPDNLQEIYSEYVGQLEKDYAELYPLIKEFADWTPEHVPLQSNEEVSFTIREYNDAEVSLRVVARPCDTRPGHWWVFSRSTPKLDMAVHGQKATTWIKIGVAEWSDQRIPPDLQGPVYVQMVLNPASKVGRSPTFSFMTTKDDTVTRSIRFQGDLWTGRVETLVVDLVGGHNSPERPTDSLKVTFHKGQVGSFQLIEFQDSKQPGMGQLCKVTLAQSRVSGAFSEASIQQYHRDLSDPRRHLSEFRRTLFKENLQFDRSMIGKTVLRDQGKEAQVNYQGDYCLYEGGFDPETLQQHGQGSLYSSIGPCTDTGLFEQGALLKGRRETENEIYEGEFQDALPHGPGSIIFQNGSKYEGEFVLGDQQGKGTFTFPNKGVYTGEMQENRLHGKGCLTLPDGGKFEGLFESDHMVHGSIYFTTSTWTLSDSLSALLQGLFMGPRGFLLSLKVCCRFYFHRVANLFRSRDQKVWAAVYTGHTNSLSQMEGRGKLTDLSGFSYEGDFLAHRPHGFGTATNLFGDKYTGEFREGAYHGRGRLESPLRNEVYEGYFVENMFHGRGTRYQVAKGSVEKTVGVWETGHLSTTEETTQEPYRNQPLSEVGRRPAEDQPTQTKCSDWQQSERPDRLVTRQTWQQAPAAALTARFQMHLWQRWFGSRLHQRRLDSRTFQPASSVIGWGLLPDQVRPRSTFNPVDSIRLLRTQAMGQKPMRLLSRSLFKLCLTKRI